MPLAEFVSNSDDEKNSGLANLTTASLSFTNSPAEPKPWGRLEITPMVLDRPDDAFETNSPAPPAIRWLFENYSPGQLKDFLSRCQLAPDQRASLLDTNRWEPATNGIWILPSLDVVKNLSEPAREKIYTVLAKSPQNLTQHFPFTYRADSFDEWLAGCELPADKVELVRKLSYRKNGRLYFADSQVFELLSTPEETRCLARTLSRVPTLLMKLRVTSNSDIDGLTQYWSRGGDPAEVKRLLRSLARVPGGASINISHFLPPVPRLCLYTYPDATNTIREDCFWTGFNFFNDRADDTLTARSDPNKTLRAEYDLVQGERQFGDLLLLLEDDTAMHMCVYIAADIVFTKNGEHPNQPWVLMRMNDMMVLYKSEKPQQWRVFRKKNLQVAGASAVR